MKIGTLTAPAFASTLLDNAQRPGFRISELQMCPTQQVPLHLHTAAQETFHVLSGSLKLSLREPKQAIALDPGETFTVQSGRPHRVANGGETSATYPVFQGIGEYDYAPLV